MCLFKVNGEAAVDVSTFERWVRCVKEAEARAAACHDRLRTALQQCLTSSAGLMS